MISILIPVYNYDCRALVRELHEQGRRLCKELAAESFAFEIIVADDASTDFEQEEQNAGLATLEHVRYLRGGENLGRARIRNFLAAQARYDYCLIIDCDALVCTPDFLRRYVAERDRADVVCGELRNPEVCPRGCELRFRYEKAAMHRRPVAYREQHPYAYLSTFNVLFHRQVLLALPFDPRCTEYGYEDALMGLMLERRGYSIAHTDIPLVHNGMDRNADFLRKTETALRVLSRLGEPLQSFSALSRLSRRLCRLHLRRPFLVVYALLRPLVRRNLLSHHPWLPAFHFYKLGEYSRLG